MDNPEYFHMSDGGSAFTPVRSSSPQYIGEYLHPRTLARYEDDIDHIDNDEDDHIHDDQHRYHSQSNSGTFASFCSASAFSSSMSSSEHIHGIWNTSKNYFLFFFFKLLTKFRTTVLFGSIIGQVDTKSPAAAASTSMEQRVTESFSGQLFDGQPSGQCRSGRARTIGHSGRRLRSVAGR